MTNCKDAPSFAVTPSSGIFHCSAVELCISAVPVVGGDMLAIWKSALTTSSMTMSVAPVLEMLAARSRNRSSGSAASGMTATCEASGSVAQSLSTLTSMPSEPIRPMQ